MRARVFSLVMVAAIATAVQAAPKLHGKPGAPVPASAPPVWVVDKAASSLNFVASMNGQAINGGFRRWDVQIVFDPDKLASSHVNATIDTGSAATGDQTRDEALPTNDWFGAKVFPPASFTSRSFKALGGDRYEVSGDLRIRNVARPVSFPFILHIEGGAAKMSGALTVDRTVFGVGQGQFKGTDAVAGAVQVRVNVLAKRKS